MNDDAGQRGREIVFHPDPDLEEVRPVPELIGRQIKAVGRHVIDGNGLAVQEVGYISDAWIRIGDVELDRNRLISLQDRVIVWTGDAQRDRVLT
jgi:hypothetical protein